MNRRLKKKLIRLPKRRPAPERPRVTTLSEEGKALARRCQHIDTQVLELERLIVGAPRQEQERRLANHDLVPPPELAYGGVSPVEEADRMSYGRQRRLQRERNRRIASFLAIACALIAFAIWFIHFFG